MSKRQGAAHPRAQRPLFRRQARARLEVEGLGTLTVDTAYGSDSFVLVDAAALGLDLTPDEARDVARMGVRITAMANEQLGFRNPANHWNRISFCQTTKPAEMRNGVLHGKNAVAIRPGKVDRSPTGTGCSARMAVLHAKGRMKVGDRFVGTSILDTEFHRSIESEVDIAGKAGIRPIVSDRALGGRHAAAHGRSRRPVPGGLPPVRHLAYEPLEETVMPIVRIELFPGRDDAQKDAIAKEITRVLQATAGIPPEATTVLFSEVRRADWFVAGESFEPKTASE